MRIPQPFLLLLAAAAASSASPAPAPAPATKAPACKAYPDDPTSWPAADAWRALNATVRGRLDAVTPPGAVCHAHFEGQDTYNAAACEAYTRGFALQPTHYNTPVDIQWDFWTNRTCVITADAASSCTIGTYPRYVIKAQAVQDVVAGVNFARRNNVRLVIKNTGHDFMGKSIGAGSLSIWTHLFKDIEIIDHYRDPSTAYKGSAVRLGAGWQVADIYARLAEVGKVIVAGECATVGFVGGYIQGGGHGPLSSQLGMAVDSVLQYTLVTAQGRHITADAATNPDVFWALRGGGGASFGVVMSVTVKTYDTPPVSGVVLGFNSTSTAPETFWAGVDAFHAFAPTLADAGIFGYYEVTSASFLAKPLLAPGMSRAKLAALTAPLLSRLDALGVAYTANTSSHRTFLDGYRALFDGESAGVNMLMSSRLIQRRHVVANASAVTAAFRLAADSGQQIIGHLMAPGNAGGVGADTSVNPVWRDGLLLPLYLHFWTGAETEAQKLAGIDRMLNVVDRAFKDASPGSGTYLNEANIYDPDWRHDFYGASYPRLLRIKKRVDPGGVFYAKTAVGSELWAERAGGRLCRSD